MLLGVSGFAGSGKDAAANFLVEDFSFCRVALADPLKRIARDVYDFTDDQLWGPSQSRNAPDRRYPRPCKLCGGAGDKVPSSQESMEPCFGCHGEQVTYLTPREVLQKLGTEWGRECYPNTWVDLCIRTAKKLLESPDAHYSQRHGFWQEAVDDASQIQGVAIPDVRFRNEMKAIKEAGGKIIRIVRTGAGLDGSGALHVSETEQVSIPDSEFDAVIQNRGTLDDLRRAVAQIVN